MTDHGWTYDNVLYEMRVQATSLNEHLEDMGAAIMRRDDANTICRHATLTLLSAQAVMGNAERLRNAPRTADTTPRTTELL